MKMTRISSLILAFTLLLMSIGFAFGQTTEVRKLELVVQIGHSLSVSSVAFGSDGKTLASGSEDGTINLWDAASGKGLKTLRGHSDYVNSVVFSPDGKTLASGSSDKTIRLWNVASGTELKALNGHAYSVDSIAFSPDGKTLASGGRDDAVKLWNVASGIELITLTGHSNSVSSVAFSRDGKTLASVSEGGTIKLWDVALGKELKTLNGGYHSVDSVAFSPDGKTLASGSFETIRLWDVASGKELKTLSGHYHSVNSVEFGPDGKILASGSSDKTIRLWDVASGTELKTLRGHSDCVNSVTFSPDGKTLTSGSSDKTIKLWDVASGAELKTLSGHYSIDWSMEFSPDGKTLASGTFDGTIKLWDVASGTELKTLSGHYLSVSSVAFSPDGKTLASGSLDSRVKLWEVASGTEMKTLSGHYHFVNSVEFGPDGKILASGSSDNTVKLWDVASGIELKTLTGHSNRVSSVAFSPDRRTLASGSGDRTVKLWDVASGTELKTLTGHSLGVDSVEFSPDGKTLASVNENGTIKLWDVASGAELKTLDGDAPSVKQEMANSFPSLFSEYYLGAVSESLMIEAAEIGNLKMSDKKTGKELATLVALDKKDWVFIAPDGRFDTNKPLDSVEGLHWVYDEQILNPLPLDIFMRQYYEPGLLQRAIKCNEEKNCDKEFKPLPSISEINRVQPKISKPSISSLKANGTVDISIEVENIQEGLTEERKMDKVSVYDLRLFRDGQLVGVSTPKDKLAQFIKNAPQLVSETKASGKLLNTPEDKAWREANDIFEIKNENLKVISPTKAVYTFKDVKLPKDGREKIEFSAYAFNSDRVKSNTVRTEFSFKPKEIKNGNTYLVSIGVNTSQYKRFNLSYAANDANKMQSVLGEKLQAKATSTNSNFYQIPLISDFEKDGKVENNATKPIIKSVFGQLAGNPKKQILDEIRKLLKEKESRGDDSERKTAEEIFEQIPVSVNGTPIKAFELPPIEPEDTLIISFSGHGYADQNGIFYVLPYDVGKDTTAVTAKTLPNFISSDELSLWMQDITSREMLMIIDACHSAAAVDGDGFKPGPMGSRGLGQLAYDKGMKILSATQANNVALELGSIEQGLLSYALLQDGIVGKKADIDEPKDNKLLSDEWLKYAEGRVGSLYDEIRNGSHNLIVNGKSATAEERSVAVKEKNSKGKSNVQEPKLFDFRANKTKNLLINLQ